MVCLLRGGGPLQSLEQAPVFNSQFPEAEIEDIKRPGAAGPSYRRGRCREVLSTAPPLPRNSLFIGQCDLLGQEKQEADLGTEHCLATGDRSQRVLVFFHTKEVNSSSFFLFNLHTQI